MAGIRKRSQLVVAYSDIFKTQSAFDNPLTNADLNAAMPLATLPTYRIVEREERDCRGRIADVPIDTQLVEWTFNFERVTPQFVYGWLAMALGVSTAPTGTPVNETQTLGLGGATGGTFTLSFAFEGLTGTTAAISATATNAEIQAALEAVRSIKQGSVSVTGTTTKTITFQGDLANANVPLLTVVDSTTGGTGVTVAAGTTGAQRLHRATRSPSDLLKLTSLIYGFEGDTIAPIKLKNLGVNTLSLTIPRRGDNVTMTLSLIGSAEKLPQPGFALPACSTISALRPEDCRLRINNTYYEDGFNNETYNLANNIITDAEAFARDSANIGSIERQDESEFIPENYTWQIFGSEGDAIYTLGENRSKVLVETLLGNPGERVEIVSPNTLVTLANDPIDFSTRNRTLISLVGRPLSASSIGGAYTNVNGYLSQSTAFLTT